MANDVLLLLDYIGWTAQKGIHVVSASYVCHHLLLK